MLKAQSDEEETIDIGGHAAPVPWSTVRVEHRQVDPRVVRPEAGAPDHHSRVQYLTVAHGEAAALPSDAPYTHDTRVDERTLRDADQGVSAAFCPVTESPADSRIGRGAPEHRPDPREQITTKEAAREVTRVAPRQPHLPKPREFERNLCT